MPRGGPVISHWHTLVDGFNTSSLDFYKSVEEAVRAREVPEATFSRVEFKEGGVASAKREYLRIERGGVAFDVGAAPYGQGFFFSWWLIRPRPGWVWLWFAGLVGAGLIWILMLLSLSSQAASQRLNASLFGGQTGGAGCAVFLVLAGFPALLFLLGWAIHEGHVPIEEEDVLEIPVVGWLYDKVFGPNTYYAMDTALMFQESVSRAVNEVIEGLLTSQGLQALSADQLKPTIRNLAG